MSVLSAHHQQIQPGDVLLLTVSEEAFSLGAVEEEDFRRHIENFSEDADIYVLVMRDDHFKNLKKLSLTDLVHLQARIEEALRDMSERDVKAEA